MSDYVGPVLQVVGAIVSINYPVIGSIMMAAGPCVGESTADDRGPMVCTTTEPDRSIKR